MRSEATGNALRGNTSLARGLRSPSRRTFLQACAVSAAGLLMTRSRDAFATTHEATPVTSWRDGDPFSLGVAAGSPATDGFVLWTRLAPQPLSSDPDAP